VHAARALQQRLDDDPGQSVRVAGGEGAEVVGPRRDRGGARVVRRGLGPKTWSGSRPAHMLCMPPTGSVTLMQSKVSPW